MTEQRHAPLTGITVLEVGAFIAAPYAATQLADLGADVIKVENPQGGDPVRLIGPFLEGESSPFVRLNRHKRSVALDLKSPEGREAFLALAAQCDVVVENLRPGAMQRLGLGHEDLSRANPGIVYASASGWGQDGPLSALAGLDIMAQARSGLMSVTGEPDRDPAKVGVPVCDLVCALYVALAVCAALRERETSGRGQHIDVSLLETGVSLAVWEAGTYFATGEVKGRSGSAHQSTAPYQALRCRDGHITVGAITPPTWEGFCSVLGLQDAVDDPRYSTASSRHEHRAELVDRIERSTSGWNVHELVDRLNRAGVPCAPISDYGQVFTDEHLAARDYFWDAPHERLEQVRQLGTPMRLSATPCRQDRAGPLLGADTRAVLAEYGVEQEQIDALAASASTASDRRDL
ncbi:CaiB/BaiF CoA transferase family protein [Nocardiopsis salina]|uniref:CaiB/BaiF CoA transferase family protein n=1 Tax=Nocardiopsis salina TaxID=245836 RepID=UPI00034822FB|nr:CoA transferase [Nocardiopsis salina]